MSFVLVPSLYGQVPALLNAAVPEFGQSDEYQLHQGEADDLPGVVLASFANFLARQSCSAASDQLRRGVAVISELWASNDGQTLEAIRDEFFGALANHADSIPVILPMMEPALRDGYARWSESR